MKHDGIIIVASSADRKLQLAHQEDLGGLEQHQLRQGRSRGLLQWLLQQVHSQLNFAFKFWQVDVHNLIIEESTSVRTN